MTKPKEPDWPNLRILIVDRDEEFRLSVRALLRRHRAGDVRSAEKPVKGYDALCQAPTDLVLLTVRKDDDSMRDFMRKLRDPAVSPCPDVPVLAVVSPEDRDLLPELAALGIDGAVPTTFNEKALFQKLSSILLDAEGCAARRAAAMRGVVIAPNGETGPRGVVIAPKKKDEKPVDLAPPPAPPPPEIGIEGAGLTEDGDREPDLLEIVANQRNKPKHSADDWAAELARKGKKPRPPPKGIDMDKIIAQHVDWLTSGGAKGRQANLSGQDLACVDIKDAMLRSAIFTGADLSDANLAGVDLNGADLRRVKLAGANLTDADLGVTRLRHADFSLATLTHTNLRGADLAGAKFKGATVGEGVQMHGAVFLETDLSDADLAQVEGMTQAQANKGRATMSTKLPNGLRRVIPSQPITFSAGGRE